VFARKQRASAGKRLLYYFDSVFPASAICTGVTGASAGSRILLAHLRCDPTSKLRIRNAVDAGVGGNIYV
jgi:hypothetical protein